MLKIENLHVKVNEKMILQGLDLEIKAGEIHAIMGPNGSGKSTLGYALSGKPGYDITEGTVHFKGKDLAALSILERAELGLFLGMQYPIELPGVNNTFFLRQAYNKKLQREHQDPLDAMDFLALIKEKMAIVGMDQSFLNRNVNEGFSGGEKKRNEVLQMLLLEPSMVVLDELDSGLDIDALSWVGKAVNVLKNSERSFLVITHYQRLLNYIVPDQVHVLSKGRIIKSGDKSLALKLEEQGYAALQVLIVNTAAEFLLQIQLDERARLHYGLIAEGAAAQKMKVEAHCQAESDLLGEHALLSEQAYHESLDVYLQGQKAKLMLTGLQYGRGRAVLEHHLCVHHEANFTESHIEFRGVADERSLVVFDGLIHVPKHVKGVDANEQTRNLLLSNTAEIDARPRLEIYSHDIACRHGASIGNLDQNALFYLQSRGFSEAEARLMLINAFMASVFNRASPIAQWVQDDLGFKYDDH